MESQSLKFLNSFYIYFFRFKRFYSKKIIGIGESGLDFYYNHSDKETQKKSFIQHINAALELDIPIIVHSRNAEIETLDILKSEKKKFKFKSPYTLLYWL